jgi:hypothetical protein
VNKLWGAFLLKKPWGQWTLLALFAWIIAITQLNFVGDVTIYTLNNNTLREEAHDRLIHNRRPEIGWLKQGSNGTNIRIAVPYLVEFLHNVTGIRVTVLYKLVDLASLWLGILIFFAFLRRWFTVPEVLLACLYLGTVLPLTFAFHNYHPWDRPSFVAWMLAFWTARDQRFWAFFAIAIVAILIKWDALPLPAIYLLANLNRQNWMKVIIQTVAVGAALLTIYICLRILIPGGFEPASPYDNLMLRNARLIGANLLSFAPLLAFGFPLLFAVVGYRDCDRFMRACLWFAALLLVPLFVWTNFEEVRAEFMLLPLLAPAALLGMRRTGAAPRDMLRASSENAPSLGNVISCDEASTH